VYSTRRRSTLCLRVIFSWLTERRRKRILATPLPSEWRGYIERNVAHFAWLDQEEQTHLLQLVHVFAEEKHWEGLGGLELTDEVRATISAQACLLILGLDHDLYRQVESILVYPSTVLAAPTKPSFFAVATALPDQAMPVLGQAFQRGPVILVWDHVRSGGIDPRDGRNVVYHEFAHKLDMLSGSADGVPPLADGETYDRWIEIFTREYEALQEAKRRRRKTFLDPYALTNGAEFFAVATEHFFEQAMKMQRDHTAMYDVLAAFYRQDTAAREKRYRNSARD
jgi:Mlc titration factor MtfA (ptsG expression regulator)